MSKKFTFKEYFHGQRMVAKTYLEFKKLAEEQIKKDNLSEDDFNDIIVGLLVTKVLVLEGKLEEKFWESAIS